MMYRGRLETTSTPRQEPVTISIDGLEHWPRGLGSLDPDVVQVKFSDSADREFSRLFDSMFPIDFDKWQEASFRRFPVVIQRVTTNGA